MEFARLFDALQYFRVQVWEKLEQRIEFFVQILGALLERALALGEIANRFSIRFV